MDQKRETGLTVGTFVRFGAVVLIVLVTGWFINYNIQNEKQQIRNEYFLDKQVIVIEDNITDLPDQINAVTLELVDSISVPTIDNVEQNQIVSAALQGAEDTGCGEGLVINLYNLTGDNDKVEAAIEAINAVNGATSEPNWVIGTPWSPTGSPWSPTGSSTSGNPTPAIEPDYQEQWAFAAIGLHDFKIVDEERMNVRVGVFDTSPVEDIETEAVDPLDLEYLLPEFVATPVPPEPGSPQDIQVANHGYFGAGFIREIAPESEIKLIRVLTENNRGDLFTLNRELLKFLAEAEQDGVPAIVNMSLGIPPLTDDVPFDFERAFETLKIITDFGECLDVVMVAASGNDSANVPHLSNYPAAWDTVLGVSASNRSNEQSCFANPGDVAAPGGDGGFDPNSNNSCVPRLDLCPGSGPSCAYAVISHVHPQVSDVEYHYWVGTSFSAPMVTGLATLLRQLDKEGTLTAAEIRRLIICGANTSSGPASVIRIPETLDCAGISYE